MYLALYRRFRPETFDTVLGQEHIVRILKNQICRGKPGHAYLFAGTRGTGKTTLARLLAKGVNCTGEKEKPCGVCENCEAIREGVFLDVIEIDAASNNSVDNVRDLQESVMFSPVYGRYKVYIIDEVHMLSAGAFNALLKTLEEPPERVIFILATTEPHKLPATIISRCLRFDFRRVPAAAIKSGMESICKAIGIDAENDALALLSSNAEGSVRDGLSLLDQCISAGGDAITRDIVLELLGSPSVDQLTELTDIVARGDVSEALIMLEAMLAQGKEERQIIHDWIGHFRNLMLIRHVKHPEEILLMSLDVIETLRRQSMGIQPEFIKECIFALSKTLNDIRWSNRPRVLLEVCLIQLASHFIKDGKEAETFEGKVKIPSAKDMREFASKRTYGQSGGAEKTVSEKKIDGADKTESTYGASARAVGQSGSLASANTVDGGNAVLETDETTFEAEYNKSVIDKGKVPVESTFTTTTVIADADKTADDTALSETGLISNIDWDAIIKILSGKSQILKRRIKNCRFSGIYADKIVIEAFDDLTMTAIKDNQNILNNAIRDQTGKEFGIEYRLAKSDLPTNVDDAKNKVHPTSDKGSKLSKMQSQSATNIPELELPEQILAKHTKKESGSMDGDEIVAQMEKMFNTKIDIE